MFAERRYADGGLGLALIRDGHGTRSFETLLRYRGAAMAEFWRALRTLKALQAEQAAAAGAALAGCPERPAARSPLAHRPQPDEPERAAERQLAYLVSEPAAPGHTLYEPAAPWLPDEPEPVPAVPPALAPGGLARHARPNEPGPCGWRNPK